MDTSTLLLTKLLFFSEINSIPPYFFHLKSFLWKGSLTVKITKKIDQNLGYISFYFEIRVHLGHLFLQTPKAIKFNRWFCSKKWAKPKVESYIYCENQYLREKRHKKWSQECKQKQPLLFNFCNVDSLFLNLIFTCCPIINISEKFKEISSISFKY